MPWSGCADRPCGSLDARSLHAVEDRRFAALEDDFVFAEELASARAELRRVLLEVARVGDATGESIERAHGEVVDAHELRAANAEAGPDLGEVLVLHPSHESL